MQESKPEVHYLVWFKKGIEIMNGLNMNEMG
jgi:hypothetical protein